jgi:hypothetical protein
MSSSHVELGTTSRPAGDHKFKGEFGFAQTKSADEEKAGSFATQTIIVVYCRPKSGLILDVLVNVVMQLCTQTSCVVEQPTNPLARAQLCAQAWANVVIAIPDAPPAAEPPVDIEPPPVADPPAALAPPDAIPPPPALPPIADAPPPVLPPVDVAPELLLLPHDQTQEATPNTKTSCPTLLLDISSLSLQLNCPTTDFGARGFPESSCKSPQYHRRVSKPQKLGLLLLSRSIVGPE